MRKLMRRVAICFVLAALVWCGTLLADRQRLNEELIRLHVVANSDSEEDQIIKLQVRDAVTKSLKKDLLQITDVEVAKAYLRENLPKIQTVANAALQAAGCDMDVVVSLCREAFDTRHYETFTLPAGVYDALRITIGDGEGENWWCVVFPSLCIPATSEDFESAAVGAGFPDALNRTLTGAKGYELRFYFLDVLGKLENILFEG